MFIGLVVTTFNCTLLSCNSYVCALSFTLGNLCVDGVDSKLVLNNESISVDLPKPVSPERHNRWWWWVNHKISSEDCRVRTLTDAQDVEDETVLSRLVRQLIGHAVEADVSIQVERAHGWQLVVLVQLQMRIVKYTLGDQDSRNSFKNAESDTTRRFQWRY